MTRTVVISPHLDDAVLSAWLVLTRGPTTVVTCFAGARPDEGTVDAVRRAEDLGALALVGAEAVHLDHDDEPVRHVPSGATRAALADDLRPHLLGADEVWLPCGIGRHPDHLLAREAADDALLAHPGHPAVRLYADLPYAARAGWPGWLGPGGGHPATGLAGQAIRLRRRAPEVAWWRAVARSGPGRWTLRWRAASLDADAQATKLHAVRTYSSQAPQLGFGLAGPPPVPELLAREAWWERRPR